MKNLRAKRRFFKVSNIGTHHGWPSTGDRKIKSNGKVSPRSQRAKENSKIGKIEKARKHF